MREGTGMMKRLLCLLLALCCLGPVWAAAEEEENRGNEELLTEFVLRHADRGSNKIAITVDDCYRSATEYILRDAELCRQYGIAMTFFPLVYTGCLEEEFRDVWQTVLDSGCEIGTHSTRHTKLGNRDYWSIVSSLGLAQEALDKTLGYHYQIRWFRPPYGSVADGKLTTKKKILSAIRLYGYEHIVHWDVSQTDPDLAIKQVKNGSILLYHAKKKDTACLEKLIPALLEAGFEPVTVSELFGFDPPETGGELYVYDKAYYVEKSKE